MRKAWYKIRGTIVAPFYLLRRYLLPIAAFALVASIATPTASGSDSAIAVWGVRARGWATPEDHVEDYFHFHSA